MRKGDATTHTVQFDAATGATVRVLAGHNGNVRGVAWKELMDPVANIDAGGATLSLTAGGAGSLTQSGALLGSNRLKPTAAATTVRVTNGKSQVLDGPYADSKEQLGGYFLIDVPDLDAAMSWAARCPASGHGVVEVRPIWEMGAAA